MLCNSGQILKNLDGVCQAVACNVAESLHLMNSASASHPVERENTSFMLGDYAKCGVKGQVKHPSGLHNIWITRFSALKILTT